MNMEIVTNFEAPNISSNIDEQLTTRNSELAATMAFFRRRLPTPVGTHERGGVLPTGEGSSFS
jgi:hypothetical protein